MSGQFLTFVVMFNLKRSGIPNLMVLIKLVLDKIGKIFRKNFLKNFRWPKTCFARGRKQASPEDHVKKISTIFWVDQKGISFLGSAQLSLLKSDNRFN